MTQLINRHRAKSPHSTTRPRAEGAKARDQWANRVDSRDLKVVDTEALRTIAELVERREEVDEELTAAVRSARRAQRSWSEIGAILISQQAAQRKYSSKTSA